MQAESYLEVSKKISVPSVGSLWKAPNKIWNDPNRKWKTGFALNKSPDGLHPSIVEKVCIDKISARLAPGTSKDYKKGSCVFKMDLNGNGKQTFFLLNLSMPILIEDLNQFGKGWNNIYELGQKDLESLIWQIKICKG